MTRSIAPAACFVLVASVAAPPMVACNRGDVSGPVGPSAAVSTPPVASSAPSAASAEPAAEPAPPPPKRRPFEIFNACTDVVTIVFGEDPKKAGGGGRTIAPSASIEGPREADGTQWVWLVDANGEPLLKVHVTRGMKRVEVGRSCRTLDAR